jgi:hypothetical protein
MFNALTLATLRSTSNLSRMESQPSRSEFMLYSPAPQGEIVWFSVKSVPVLQR